MRSWPIGATNIDPQSRLILQRFGLLVAFLAMSSATIGWHKPLGVFGFMTFCAACVEAGIALVRRERLFAADRLGRWDLATALFGLHCLADGLA